MKQLIAFSTETLAVLKLLLLGFAGIVSFLFIYFTILSKTSTLEEFPYNPSKFPAVYIYSFRKEILIEEISFLHFFFKIKNNNKCFEKAIL